MREILSRFVKGQSLPIPKESVYNDSEEVAILQKMDKFEQMDYLKELKKSNEQALKDFEADQSAKQAKPTGEKSGEKAGDKVGDKPSGEA